MIYVLAIVIIIVAFIIWRYTSVSRGARKRDEKILSILDPYAQKLETKQDVSADDILEIAERPQLRPLLYCILDRYEKLDLFPDIYLNEEKQAEAQLAYWMMHPNECGDAPAEIKCYSSTSRTVDGKDATFHLVKYQMREGHWAYNDGFLVGVVGPFYKDDTPYLNTATAFSRSDKHSETKPEELVDWYMKIQGYESA